MSHVTIQGPVLHGAADVAKIVMEEAEKGMQLAYFEVQAQLSRVAAQHRRTGHYLRSFAAGDPNHVQRVDRSTGRITATFGSRLNYAAFLEYGTGLYGPRGQKIVPKKPGGVLAFPGAVGPGTAFTLSGRQRSGRAGAAAGSQMVFARSSKGIKPLALMKRASVESREAQIAQFRKAGVVIARRLAAAGGRP
jgi:hypothetical protein